MKAWRILLAIILLFPPTGAIAKGTERQVADPRALFPTRIGIFARHGRVERDRGGDPFAHYWAGSLVLATVYIIGRADTPSSVSLPTVKMS